MPLFSSSAEEGGGSGGCCSILITFDLDDTLFPIGPVVEEANVAQIKAMQQKAGYQQTTMEQCMKQTRSIRQSLTQPITYTNLRKQAIRAELVDLVVGSKSSLSSLLLDQFVEECFDAWLQERHAAAERHLFKDAIQALQELQDTFGGKNNNNNNYDLCIGGITNGRGNPLDMINTLAPYFTFCVSGEDDDVFPHRKPNPQIYEAALDRWSSSSSTTTKELKREGEEDDDKGNDDDRRQSCSPDVWIHVGDCLANDVGASHDVGAKPIWVAPPKEEEEDGKQPSWSTATKKDLEERAILMEAARSKMSGQITNLSELTSVVQGIVDKEWSRSSSGGGGEQAAVKVAASSSSSSSFVE